MERIGYWIKAMRATLLPLPVATVLLGTSIGVAQGEFLPLRAFLALTGVALLQVSLMFLNDYSDFNTGIDYQTTPTPFSGGSGMLTSGKIEPAAMRTAGVVCLLGGAGTILALVWITSLSLLPLLLVGVFAVWTYTEFLHRHTLGEVFSGLGLGLAPVIGSTFVQTQQFSVSSVAAGLVAGILSFTLLLLCEYPDLEADIQGGRKNLIIVFGPETAGKIYAVMMCVMYVLIAVCVAARVFPFYCVAALASFVLAWKPMKWAWSTPHSNDEIVAVLAANVTTYLATLTLLSVGFLVSVIR